MSSANLAKSLMFIIPEEFDGNSERTYNNKKIKSDSLGFPDRKTPKADHPRIISGFISRLCS